MFTRFLQIAFAVMAVSALVNAGDPIRFKVRIEDVSTAETLKLSSGETAPAPVSPGAWAVHAGNSPIFQKGKRASEALERQAEDGNPGNLAMSLKQEKAVRAAGTFDTPAGDSAPGPALPGKSYEFSIEALPGDNLSLISMFGQSNDLFYAPEKGIALFDRTGTPISGDITSLIMLWDAGTEVNQEPGTGPDQAPRQKAVNTGQAENKSISTVRDKFTYPSVAQVIRVTITPETRQAE